MTSTKSRPIDLNPLIADLTGLDIITDAAQIAKLSQDYYTFSPVLQPLLEKKTGDLVVRPANEAEVLRVPNSRSGVCEV